MRAGTVYVWRAESNLNDCFLFPPCELKPELSLADLVVNAFTRGRLVSNTIWSSCLSLLRGGVADVSPHHPRSTH